MSLRGPRFSTASLAAIAVCLLLPLRSDAQQGTTPGSLDPSFSSSASTNFAALSVAVQPDGKIVLGGGFNVVNGETHSGIARLNADGTVDRDFLVGAGTNNTVSAVLVQPDGRIVLGGAFTTVSGQPRSGLARLNADGTLDTGFKPTLTGGAPISAYALALQPDGKLLVGGAFLQVNGTARSCIARLNADGSLDGSFNPGTGTNGSVETLLVQADGKVLLGGRFFTVAGAPRGRLARLNADGALDASFNAVGSGADSDVLIVSPQADGKLVIGGVFTTFNGVSRRGLARLNADGSLDGSFNPSVVGPNPTLVIAVLTQPGDGRLLIGGQFASVNGAARTNLARLNADGSLDGSFNPTITGTDNPAVAALAQQPDGPLVVAGRFDNVNGEARNGLARLFSGSLHPPFFNGEVLLGNGVYYLAFPSGNPFGYYAYLSDPRFIYHFDLGYEYLFDAQNAQNGIFLYDFASQSFFYTAPSFPFPYLYDFSLSAILYYFPDPNNPGRYNTNGVRYFYNFATGQVIVK